MDAFLTGAAPDELEQRLQRALVSCELGPVHHATDWTRAGLDWASIDVVSGALKVRRQVQWVGVWPGGDSALRDPVFSMRLIRDLTALTGGFGAAWIHDALHRRCGQILAYAGRTLEAVSMADGQDPVQWGGPEQALARMDAVTNAAVFGDRLERMTRLTTADIRYQLVNGTLLRSIWDLVELGAVGALDQNEETPLSRVVLALSGDEFQDAINRFAATTAGALSSLEGWRWSEQQTPSRIADVSWEYGSEPFVLMEREGALSEASLQPFFDVLKPVIATAYEIAGGGRPTRWVDWELGAMRRAGEASSGDEFFSIFREVAQVLDADPGAFCAPIGTGGPLVAAEAAAADP